MENRQRHEIEDLAVGIAVGMFVMQSAWSGHDLHIFCSVVPVICEYLLCLPWCLQHRGWHIQTLGAERSYSLRWKRSWRCFEGWEPFPLTEL